MGALIYFLLIVDDNIFYALDSVGEAAETSPAVLYPIYIFTVGSLALILFLYLRRQEVRRWFPAKAKSTG